MIEPTEVHYKASLSTSSSGFNFRGWSPIICYWCKTAFSFVPLSAVIAVHAVAVVCIKPNAWAGLYLIYWDKHRWCTSIICSTDWLCIDVALLQHIKNFYNTTYSTRRASDNATVQGSGLDDFTLTFLWSLTTTLYVIGGMFGAYFAGFLANRVGRQVFLKHTVLHFIQFLVFVTCVSNDSAVQYGGIQ